MIANDRDTLEGWIDEQLHNIPEGTGPGTGAVRIFGGVHHGLNGNDTPFLSMTQSSPNWGKAGLMADAFDLCATRWARGVAGGGVQQFSLIVCREGGKPCGTIPFTRASAPNIVGGGGYGALASEPPTAAGAMAQAQRLLEVLATGAFAQIGHVTTTQAQIIDKMSARLDTVEKRADERWLALQNLLSTWMQQSVGLQLRALGVEAGRKLLPLLPGAISSLAGNDKLVPEQAVSDSLFDTLLENQTSVQLQELLGTISSTSGGGPMAAILADHLLRAKKRKAAREREHAELISGWPSRTYDQGEDDAAGAAIRALGGGAAKHASGNGHANPTAQPQPPAADAGAMASDAMLDVMLSSLSDGEIDQVAMLFATKRPDIPGIAAQIKARYASLKKGKAA